MNGIFVTGTDTDIGKTIVSAILCASLRHSAKPFAYFKPIQTGMDEDCKTLRFLARLSDSEIENPIYYFPEPLSPDRAAALNGKTIQISKIVERFHELPAEKFYVVEGAGGVMVPIHPEFKMRDLMAALKIPALVVASTRLGTINHTLLTLEALAHAKVNVCGIVLNGPEDPVLKKTIEHHSRTRVIAEVPHFNEISPERIDSFCGAFNKTIHWEAFA